MAWKSHGRRAATGASLTLALALLLAACASGPTGGRSATPTLPSEASATLAAGTSSGKPTPSPTPAGVAGSGSLDICQPVTPTPITISVPAEIPIYGSGQIKLAEADGPTSEFGYCIHDTVSAVGNFYAKALPGKGWSNVQVYVNLATENITATRGSETLTITVSPDTLQPGNTDLLIILQGQ
jgi:hypothetical protein